MRLSKPLRYVSLSAVLLSQAACIGSTPPSRFYLLEPQAVAEASGAAEKITLALAPVRIPQYLDRAQLVSASGRNAYQLNELHRWAENLGDNMTRVMLQDLTHMLPAEVMLTTSQSAKKAQWRLAVTVLEFHVDPQGQAGLTAQWQVSRADEVVWSQQSAYKEAASNDDAQLQVEALNHCLSRLNRDMAEAVKALKAPVMHQNAGG